MITNEQHITFDKVVDIISKCNMNSHLVLIGSWAEYLYQKNNILGSSYNSFIQTRDIDFLIKNKNVPARKTDFIEKMENAGFIFDINRSNNINRFFEPKSGMEVEFLLQERGQGRIEGHKITSLGITVEGLRHLDILQTNPHTVEHNGNNILIPSPESYVLHKLVINRARQEDKKNKDIEAVINILDCIAEIPIKCSSFESLKDKLSKNERKSLDNVVNSNPRLTELFLQITEKSKEVEQPSKHNLRDKDSPEKIIEERVEESIETGFDPKKDRLQSDAINNRIKAQSAKDVVEKAKTIPSGGLDLNLPNVDLNPVQENVITSVSTAENEVNNLIADAASKDAEAGKISKKEAINMAKEIMGKDTLVTSARVGQTCSGEIIVKTDLYAIQRLTDNRAVLYEIKDISDEANVEVGAKITLHKKHDKTVTINDKEKDDRSQDYEFNGENERERGAR